MRMNLLWPTRKLRAETYRAELLPY